jgi:hypothetical protein
MPALFYAAPYYGTLSYGNYVFNNTTVTHIDGGPVYSKDGRAVTHCQWMIRFRTLVENATGAEMRLLLATLEEPRLRFVCQGRGVDSIVGRIDTGTYRDVNFGPKPKRLAVRPYAVRAPGYDSGGPSCAVDWSIEVAVPCCDNARRAGPMELSAEVSFEIDYSGLCTRRWTGELRIANNVRADGRGATDVPDAYREAVTPDLLPGFDRTFDPWRTSDDRTRLYFGITDTERPSKNIPPPFVVGKARCGQHVSTVEGKGLRLYILRFTGEYELSPDCPDIYIPTRHFFETFVGGRIDWLARQLLSTSGPQGALSIIPLAFDAGEPDVLGRPVHTFSATFRFTCQPSEVIFASGLFRPIGGVSWTEYALSLSTSAFNPYGATQLRFLPADDGIINGLCGPVGQPSAGETERILRTRPGQFDFDEWLDRVLKNVNEKTSWVDFDNRLTVIPISGNVEIRTLPPSPPPPLPPGLGAVVGAAAGAAFDAGNVDKWAEFDRLVEDKLNPKPGGLLGGIGGIVAGVVSAVQQRVPDRFKVVMEGHALRVGFLIPPPTLLEIGGVKAVAMFDRDHDYFVPNVLVRDVGGLPMYASKWRLTFQPESFPIKTPIEPLPNPMFDV